MSDVKTCAVRIPVPYPIGPPLPCGEPKVEGSSVYCYWHRLARTSTGAQESGAMGRLSVVPVTERRTRVPEREWPKHHRWCAGCQTMVPLWYCSGSRCKACARMANRNHRVEQVYGLNPAGQAHLLNLQDGRCAICRKGQLTKMLALDHDHKTGAVRGYLCQRCNHDLLGAAYDNVDILRAAVRYLETPPAGGAWTPPEMDGRNAP